MSETANPARASVVGTDQGLLDAYSAFLFYERRLLMEEMYGPRAAEFERFVPTANPGATFHWRASFPATWADLPKPSTRAAAVFTLLGFDLELAKPDIDGAPDPLRDIIAERSAYLTEINADRSRDLTEGELAKLKEFDRRVRAIVPSTAAGCIECLLTAIEAIQQMDDELAIALVTNGMVYVRDCLQLAVGRRLG